MNGLPQTAEFLRAAQRIIWFEPPEIALKDPVRFLAYAMKHSTDEDMALLLGHVGLEGIREALDNAPAGVIDARSWAYWNIRVGRTDIPPIPTRDLRSVDVAQR